MRATDACLTNVSVSPLRFSWQVFKADGTTPVLKANGTTLSGIDPIFGATLDFGTYVVKYTVTDLCMNIAGPYVYTVTIKDCKTPTIICHDVSAELMWTGNTGNARGMVTVWATDLLASPLSDNCTSQGFLNSKLRAVRQSANPGNTFPTGSTSFDFNCADKGSVVPVQLWTIDSAGNADYCLSYVTVQDNLSSACTTTQARVNVAGAVRAEANQPVTAVTVSATAAGIVAGTATTTTTGDFTVNGLTAGQNLQIRAARANDNDKAVGITTYDIALISKHILDIDHLATPYKMIAADVNKDAAIDALDMLELRRFILHINPTLRGGVWRFIDKSYTFRNAANPFGEDFPEVINLLNVTSSTVTNFTAVKLGDVNDSYDATQVRGARSLTFNANDMNLTAGNEYSVAISAENFNALAFQGTFTFNGATVKSIKVGDLNNLTDANFGIFNNEVTTSWNGKAVATANVVTINFVATKSGKLSDMLTFGSAKTIAEANDAQGVAVNVGLKFNTGKVSGAEFALYQNTPNPVAQTTTIGFNMPKEGQAKLTIYNVEGKVLRTLNGDYKVGFNSIEVNKTELNATGILYYRLDTQDNSATRKMIIID